MVLAYLLKIVLVLSLISVHYSINFPQQIKFPLHKKVQETKTGNPIEQIIKGISADDSNIRAALIKAAADIVVASLQIYTVRLIVSQIGKVVESFKKIPVETSRHMKNYLPVVCQLDSYELEILNSVTDPGEMIRDFNCIGGLEQSKTEIQSFMVDILTHELLFNTTTMKPSQSMLMFGPPGNGKTSMVQASCCHFKLPMISIVPSLLQRKYYGETNQLLKAVFSLAKKLQPCVLFIDEVDSILRARSDTDQDHDRNLKVEFLQVWDDLIRSNSKVIIFGATNRPQDLDPSVHRRFERSMLIAPPTFHDRVDIFHTIFASDHIKADIDYKWCATLTDGYAASDILAVCKAATSAVNREHFSATRKSLPSSINDNNLAQLIRDKQLSSANFTMTENYGRPPAIRAVNTTDIEEALKIVYPTAWNSKSYGGLST